MKKLIAIIALIITAAGCVWAEKTVAELNPGFDEAMTQAMRPKNVTVFGYPKETKPFSLFWFTDIHGDEREFGRLIEFFKTYRRHFDGAICTGDMMRDSAEHSDFDYWAATPGHEEIMSVIGNHDVLRNDNNYVNINYDDILSMRECYVKYFAPFIGKWGVNYIPGKTYYYKDFDNKKIRLVVLDNMQRKNEPKAVIGQLAWLKDTLAGAREKDLSVIIAAHYNINDTEKIECNFTEKSILYNGEFRDCDLYMKIVDDFRKEGGKFVCWIAGHLHRDFIIKSKKYPGQLCIVCDAACDWQSAAYSETARVPGMKCGDLADTLVVDTSRHLIKLIRVGATMDGFMRPKNEVTLDYLTGEIVTQY